MFEQAIRQEIRSEIRRLFQEAGVRVPSLNKKASFVVTELTEEELSVPKDGVRVSLANMGFFVSYDGNSEKAEKLANLLCKNLPDGCGIIRSAVDVPIDTRKAAG